MALVTFPDVPIQSMSMRLRNAVSISESPFSFAQQVYRHQGSRWEAEVTLSPLTYTQAKSFQAFLAALQGQTNTFQFGNPLHDESFDVTTTAGRHHETPRFRFLETLSQGETTSNSADTCTSR